MKKQRVVDRPSLLFADMQKLQTMAKVQTALARIPSFTLSSPVFENFSSSVVESYKKRRTFAKKIQGQLSTLQMDFFGGNGASMTSDIYERMVRISQEITNSLQVERKSFSHRYLMSPRALLSSRRHLISPRTRFSLAWRLTVTNCLLLEVFRLCSSWRLSETFSISLSQIFGRLLVECKAPEKTNNILEFITDRINDVRRRIFDALPILGPKPVDIAICVPSGPQALLIFHFGRMLEIFVDLVVFFDIYVWFMTGDIDVDTHSIIPKPFITRCIIPGTLVQVLDHPTLPTLLPNLVSCVVIGMRPNCVVSSSQLAHSYPPAEKHKEPIIIHRLLPLPSMGTSTRTSAQSPCI